MTNFPPQPNNYAIRVTRIQVVPVPDPLYSERATNVSITDEAAGEFVEIDQQSAHAEIQKIAISPDEWPAVKFAIDWMIGQCRKGER